MPIYTTYLGYLNKHRDAAQKLGSCFVYYVMRNRGNNEVAPSETVLNDAKAGRITWEEYVKWYEIRLSSDEAQLWMEKRAQYAQIGNILLVCYEKDHTHCHRRLLAEEIARRHGVEYKGELSDEGSSGM